MTAHRAAGVIFLFRDGAEIVALVEGVRLSLLPTQMTSWCAVRVSAGEGKGKFVVKSIRALSLALVLVAVLGQPSMLFSDQEDPRIAIEQAAELQGDSELISEYQFPYSNKGQTDSNYLPGELEQKLASTGIDDAAPRGAPPNDLCENAIVVTDGSYPFSNAGATSSGLTDTICNFGFGDGGALNSDIWYVYQAPYTGRLTVSLCGSAYDTKLAIYSGQCPSQSNRALACDEDTCNPGLQSTLTLDITADEFYYIRVGGFNGEQGGGTMTLSSGEAPPNDDCASAIELPCEGLVVVDNTFATNSSTDPAFGCFTNGAAKGTGSLWYKFVSPHGSIFISTCNSPSATDTLVALYDDVEGCPVELSNELGCGEDECGFGGGVGGTLSQICIGSIVPGRTYYIQVATFNNASRGSIQLELDCPCPIGPDVIVGGIFGTGVDPESPSWNIVKNWGRVAASQTTGYSVGTISCNPGDVPVQWNALNDKHPVIGQQLYRLKNGRFEQIGMSWVKHGFLALTEDYCELGCIPSTPNDGTTLGVGCSDPYNNDLNGTTTRLGPRGHINAFTGIFPFPYSVGVPFPPPGPPATIGRRLQVKDADLIPAQNIDAKYYIEGHYITSDDATLGNGLNNASTREVVVTNPSGSIYTLTLTGPDLRMTTGINLWKINDPAVVETIIDVPNEGRFILAAKATDLGNGTWNYEYALYNYNSDRSGQYVRVPVPAGVSVTNLGYHDVDYHSGDSLGWTPGAILNTDWTSTVGANFVRWETTTYASNPRSNALRWATLYNYRFDAAASPTTGTFEIGLFKPGSPASISGDSVVPAPPVLVDIQLAPATQSVLVDDIIEVTMSLSAQGASSGPVTKVDAILNWDPALLEFVEYDITGAGYAWDTHGFPVDPDGLNLSMTDGDAFFEVTTVAGTPADAPAAPGSLAVATFRFRALAETAATSVSLDPIATLDETRVIGLGTGDVRTGSISSTAEVTIDPIPIIHIDAVFTPASQVKTYGDVVEITLTLSADDIVDGEVSALDAILLWDPARLDYFEYDITGGGYAWDTHGFPADPDGLNTSLTDGDALFRVTTLPGLPATVPPAPGTMVVVVFRFYALTGAVDTTLKLMPTFGLEAETRITGGDGVQNVTGDISNMATVYIIGPCSPTVGDLDGDTFYTQLDVEAAVAVYLGDDTDPDHIIAADANCDGEANGSDIQPLTDYLLLPP